MHTRKITKQDFDVIVSVIDQWWGGPTSALAHPIFFYEFGEHALVAEEDGAMIGFLLGFVTGDQPRSGYIHLVGIDPACRRRGVGRALYEAFSAHVRTAGGVRLKAITTRGNQGSLEFHRALGYHVEQEPDYAGPGRPRYVFTRDL